MSSGKASYLSRILGKALCFEYFEIDRGWFFSDNVVLKITLVELL